MYSRGLTGLPLFGVPVCDEGHQGMPWPAGGSGTPPCVVEKNAVYYDNRIVFLRQSQAKRSMDCCSSCSAYNKANASAVPPSDAKSPPQCNLWTW